MDMDERFFEPSRNLSSFAIFLISLFLVCAQLNSSAVNSRRDSINELIFRIDEEFGLKPKEIGGEVVLAIDPSSKKAPKLVQTLKAWLAQIDSEKSGEITAEQLAEWKAKFGA